MWFKSIIIYQLLVCILVQGEDKDSRKTEEIWEQDLSNEFKIEASTEGIVKLNLKCGADSMNIELETENDFDGVMYTRGSFHKQIEPCFVRAKNSITMKFSFNQCQTLHDDNIFSNVIVVQHDPDLVTPGDAAFTVECDFRKPRSITVNSDVKATEDDDEKKVYGSRITLTSPDPSIASNVLNKHETIFSETDTVTFVPEDNGRIMKAEGTVESVKIEKTGHMEDEL